MLHALSWHLLLPGVSLHDQLGAVSGWACWCAHLAGRNLWLLRVQISSLAVWMLGCQKPSLSVHGGLWLTLRHWQKLFIEQ